MDKVKRIAWISRASALVIIVASFVLALGCKGGMSYSEWKAQLAEAEAGAAAENASPTLFSSENALPLADNPALYAEDDDGSVVTMFLTVSRGNTADNTDHSWGEVNAHSIYYYEDRGIERYACEALLQVGTEDGPAPGELGYGRTTPNATVKIRGATTSKATQKSYRIDLRDSAGLWRQQRVITLNKHVYDVMRFTNKLSYDLMESIPALLGQRTQFVHLYVRDLTEGGESAAFQDYGLFTQIEQPNTRYLKNHGWDPQGQFYQVEAFSFQKSSALKLATDPAFDQKAFESLLSIKGSNDHSKLLAMVEAVNDPNAPIEETFERYFDAENYFTFLAFNILTGNTDTQQSNAYLYSPSASDKWYFVCWDCDYGFKRDYWSTLPGNESSVGYARGIATYWGNQLHRRVLTIPAYRAKLDAKIEELHAYLSPERVGGLIEVYRPIVEKYLFQTPDITYSRLSHAEWNRLLDALPNEAETNYQLYKDTLEEPMPFWIGVPSVTADGTTEFVWDPAYDFNGENILYTFKLGTTFLFEEPIAEAKGLQLPQFVYDGTLAPGEYFCYVDATNESGRTQRAIDYYADAASVQHYGVIQFYVKEDGSIVREEQDVLGNE